MHDLRLTHGGFYRHFDSREELFTEAFRESLEELSEKMLSALEHATKGGDLKALINRYLSIEHSEDVAARLRPWHGGCASSPEDPRCVATDFAETHGQGGAIHTRRERGAARTESASPFFGHGGDVKHG